MNVKLTSLLMLAFLVQASASIRAQNISLTGKNISIKSVFKEIRKQTGYNVLWEQDKLKTNRTIDAKFKNTPLNEVMVACLEG